MATTLAVIVFPILFTISLIFAVVKKKKVWVIATVILGMLMGGMLFLMATGTLKGIETASQRASRPMTVHDANRSISIEIPGDWSTLYSSSADATLYAGNTFRYEYLLIIAEPKVTLDETINGESYARLASNSTTQALTAGSCGRLQPTEINGMSAWQCEISGWDGDTEIAYFNTYVEAPRHFYQILAWTTDPSKKKRAFPRFRSAVVTFQELQ